MRDALVAIVLSALAIGLIVFAPIAPGPVIWFAWALAIIITVLAATVAIDRIGGDR